MKWGRAAAVVLLVVLLGAALALRVVPAPFVAVASGSMSPALERGDLILVRQAPAQLHEGDIVVIQVPLAIQQRYNYPPAIVHRIVKIDVAADGSQGYRTKGDAGPEDAFTSYPSDVMGLVGQRIEYAGYPILFLYSQQGLVFLIGTGAIYALYVASERLHRWTSRGMARVASAIGAAAAADTRRMHDASQERLGKVEGALDAFSLAMRDYATHLQSHTMAVQQMAQAAKEIRDSVAIQQKVLLAALAPSEPARPAADPPPLDSTGTVVPHALARIDDTPLEGDIARVFRFTPSSAAKLTDESHLPQVRASPARDPSPSGGPRTVEGRPIQD